jgi:hypothetical protein
MAFARLTGCGMYYPTQFTTPMVGNPHSFASTLLIDATGEKIALCGPVWFPSRTGTKNITRVQFRFGAVTKAGGSGLTLSLQDISTSTAGNLPDEVQDQTVAIAAAGVTANTWYRTNALNATRTVSCGDQLAVVLEFDGSGRLGADSFVWSSFSLSAAGLTNPQMTPSLKTSGSWSPGQSCAPVMALEFDDGTFGTIESCQPISAVGAVSYALVTAGADEYALQFTVPFPCKVDALWANFLFSNNSTDVELCLYQGTTLIEAIAFDATMIPSTGSSRCHERPLLAERTLIPGVTYYVSVRPTAGAIDLRYVDVSDVNHWSLTPLGPEAILNSRLDQGAWSTATTTRRPHMGVRISALDDGTGTFSVTE